MTIFLKKVPSFFYFYTEHNLCQLLHNTLLYLFFFSFLIVVIPSISTPMDIVLCIDYTSSMTSYFNTIREKMVSFSRMALKSEGDIRIGLVKFRSDYDSWKTNLHGFTDNINVLRQWLYHDEPGGISPDGYEAVGKDNRFQ